MEARRQQDVIFKVMEERTSIKNPIVVKNRPQMWETQVRSLEKGMATHSSILARRILWTEEPIELQSMGSQRVGHD